MTAPQPDAPAGPPVVEVCVTEELDLAYLPEAAAVFDRLLSLRPVHLVVDLSACPHVDAAGIGLLLDVHRRLARRGAVLSVRDPNPRIRRILRAARVDHLLPMIGTAPAPAGEPAAATGPLLAAREGRP
ncbi:STAS domain-containing protein [Micromonospora sp. NPDC000089]|uniref:STAS domain-containing protein n=1 Tax=unclassified Micromonospora TaxID=2617518 RepID=UPI0036958BF9